MACTVESRPFRYRALDENEGECTDTEDEIDEDAGICSVTRVPCPGSLAISTFPPCNCAMLCTMASPRPVPPEPLERDESTRKKRSNTLGRASAGMPAPVSETSMRIVEKLSFEQSLTEKSLFEESVRTESGWEECDFRESTRASNTPSP